MAETANTAASHSQPPEEFHWAISYLREDIQDVRNEIRGVHARIDESNRSQNERIDETNRSLGERIDETNRSLSQRIEESSQLLNARIDDLSKRLDSRFTWMMTTMVALTGVIVAVIKI